jgi:hypothetical protein
MSYIDWILPLKIKNLLKHFFKKKDSILKETETKEIVNPILETNQGLNNSVGENKTCYILACGPSINEMDLSKLINKDCISVSNFFVHPLYKQIQPKYHVFAPHHEPITEKQYLEWIKEHNNTTNFNQQLFIHEKYINILKDEKSTLNKSNFFYKTSNILAEDYKGIIIDEKLPDYQTVVHLAIYVAISKGYKEIYLLGIDHNWLFNFGKSIHFYDEDKSLLSRTGYNEYHNIDLEAEFKSHAKLWEFYKSIKRYTIANNIKIYNSTPNSFLDVFEFKLIPT